MDKKKIYTVATAHLDTIWCWDFETTVSQYLYNTLADNFKLLDKYPTYKFNFEGSYRYELMQEYYPELFERLKEYVAQGRWNVCGSAFENGDVNVPSPEALIRNILIGNNYFDKMFGKRSRDIYLPDCFGFGYALPAVMRHCNLDGFTTQKLSWGSAFGIPFDIGKWQGSDGSFVFASVNPGNYYSTFSTVRHLPAALKKLKENEKFGINSTYMFHGAFGDRGGAPKERSVACVEKEISKNSKSKIEVIAATADEIYSDLAKLPEEATSNFPVWNNELVMQNHGVGAYTSRSIGKRWMQKNEELADMAERASVIAEYSGTSEYNAERLTKAWKRVIAHQFHDDITGTAVERSYRRCVNEYALSLNEFRGELSCASSSVADALDTSFCKGQPVAVCNYIERARTGVVSVILDGKTKNYIRVYDENGEELPSQFSVQPDGKINLLFAATVPAMGFKVFDIRDDDEKSRILSTLSVSKNTLENEKYRVKLNSNGDIASIFDKQLCREILKSPVSLSLYKYTGSASWPAWEMNYKQALGKPDRNPVFVSSGIVENGPARVAIEVTQQDKNRTMIKNIISLDADGQCVEVHTSLEWQSLKTLAKYNFNFTCENEKATYDLGLGTIKRGNMSKKLFEVPAQKWADISDECKDFGVSVISECKHGWDKPDNSTLRLTALHTPLRNYRTDSLQSFMDIGLNMYSFAIFGHNGDDLSATQLEAKKFTQPLTAVLTGVHTGRLGTSLSFCSVSSDDVIVRAVKKAEDGDGIIIRINEGAGRHCDRCVISLGGGIESGEEVYGSEEKRGDLTLENGSIITSLEPYAIKSFRVRLKDCAETAANSSIPMDLPLDKCLISSFGKINPDFTLSIDRAQIGQSVTANGVTFNISQSDDNACLMNGQKINVPQGAKKAYLLAASTGGDKALDFDIDGEICRRNVCSMAENIAGWDFYGLKDEAYIKDCTVGFTATHSLTNGKRNIAAGLTLFVIELDCDGKSVITLPRDCEAVIVSGAFSKNENDRLATAVTDTVSPDRVNTFALTPAEKARAAFRKTPLGLGFFGLFSHCLEFATNIKESKRVREY